RGAALEAARHGGGSTSGVARLQRRTKRPKRLLALREATCADQDHKRRQPYGWRQRENSVHFISRVASTGAGDVGRDREPRFRPNHRQWTIGRAGFRRNDRQTLA